MPMYFARWPDGSFSVVHAVDEQDAYVQLDEFGAEPAELRLMESCLIDFELTDSGTFRLCQFGDDTLNEILENAYPLLDAALSSELLDEHGVVDDAGAVGRYGDSAKAILSDAVRAERERFKSFEPVPASTEIGKTIQGQLGGSGHYVDALVEMVAEERLRKEGRRRSQAQLKFTRYTIDSALPPALYSN
ncbi:MAG TPA: hypothetical protein VMQ86_14280 [Bryobacteraceae bacterium]|jgi:hypothetical protein|nr:hypothetical protein [Bryobacteraceae bacterium]